MIRIKNILICLLLVSFAGIGFAQHSISVKTITDKQHPRILLLNGEERLIEQSIASSPVWEKMHQTILKECDRIIDLPQLS